MGSDGDGRAGGGGAQRRSLAPHIRVAIMAGTCIAMLVFVVLPLTSTDSISAHTSDQLLTADVSGGKAGRLRHARTPFDLVYMWVNGSDSEYARRRAKLGGLSRPGDRDRDNGELLYSLRYATHARTRAHGDTLTHAHAMWGVPCGGRAVAVL